jgi:hypothetical protein
VVNSEEGGGIGTPARCFGDDGAAKHGGTGD